MSFPSTSTAYASSSSTSTPSIFQIDQDPHKRPFDPRSTMILLGSLALRTEASRLGYRSGYSEAQHIIRDAPKEPILEAFSPIETSSSSIGGMAKSVTQGIFHGFTNLTTRGVTGVARFLQGASHGDISRIRDVFIRYVHYHNTTEEEKDILRWAILGIRKVAEAYAGEQGTLQALAEITQIGTNALNGSLPKETPDDFGAEWRKEEISLFHTKLRDSFALMQALMQVETSVQAGIAKSEKSTLGASLQAAIESALKSKADQYERTMTLGLAAQSARYTSSTSLQTSALSPAQMTSSSRELSSAGKAGLLIEQGKK